ncbi:hypothetical protein [Spirosoma radiotolerans]|nr:hypothetical protein [Spirosoma radiotolerans]
MLETPYYPNWSTLLIFFLLGGFVVLMWFVHSMWQTTAIHMLNDGTFSVKKAEQTPTQHAYTSILAYNERPSASRTGTFMELTIYLTDNWFVIRSNEFRDYAYLKETFTQYGQAIAFKTVLTKAEKIRLRWLIIAQSMLILVNIAFGYLAHNAVEKTPAPLASLTDVVVRVKENRNKSRLTGVTLTLRGFPGYSFYVARHTFDNRLDTLRYAIRPNQPITLLLRQSDLQKKLVKTEPLTFGDKYDHYSEISIFGVEQGDFVRILAPNLTDVQEPTHTNPIQRTCLLGFLLLLCWVGWITVDRQPVIGAD